MNRIRKQVTREEFQTLTWIWQGSYLQVSFMKKMKMEVMSAPMICIDASLTFRPNKIRTKKLVLSNLKWYYDRYWLRMMKNIK